jgi:hypothetical protein
MYGTYRRNENGKATHKRAVANMNADGLFLDNDNEIFTDLSRAEFMAVLKLIGHRDGSMPRGRRWRRRVCLNL